MLSFLLTVVITAQSQQPFANNTEWVAEGWEIQDRITYQISDYVEPYSINENGVAEYFIEMCFTDEGEFRCAIAGDGEVVFLSEDGSVYTVTIPEYRNISLSPDSYLALISSSDSNQYLINAINGSIELLDVGDDFYLDWLFSSSGHVIGIGRLSLVFCDESGSLIKRVEYPDITGMPAFANWAISSRANLLVLLNSNNRSLEGYSLSGEYLWEIGFPSAARGLAPLAISDNGICIAVSRATEGLSVLNSDDLSIGHYLDGQYVYSIVVSSDGTFVAAVASSNSHDDPAIYILDVYNKNVTQIDAPSQNWFPSVRFITDSSMLLCGYKRTTSLIGSFSVTGQRVSLIDCNSDYQWLSSTSCNDNFQCKNIMQCIDLPVQINGGFAAQVTDTPAGYRVCYLDTEECSVMIFNIQ